MKWLNSIFSKKPDNKLRLRFSKQNDAWVVLKNEDIVYMGIESLCRKYMHNFNRSSMQK